MNATDAARPTDAQTPVDDLAIESDPQPQPKPSAPKPSAPERDEAGIAETERQPT